MPSLSTVKNFLRFQVQDTHNASFFTKMSWKGRNLSDDEVTQNILERADNPLIIRNFSQIRWLGSWAIAEFNRF